MKSVSIVPAAPNACLIEMGYSRNETTRRREYEGDWRRIVIVKWRRFSLAFVMIQLMTYHATMESRFTSIFVNIMCMCAPSLLWDGNCASSESDSMELCSSLNGRPFSGDKRFSNTIRLETRQAFDNCSNSTKYSVRCHDRSPLIQPLQLRGAHSVYQLITISLG
jgi:hypothetical protein